jgi:hypothetical protein
MSELSMQMADFKGLLTSPGSTNGFALGSNLNTHSFSPLKLRLSFAKPRFLAVDSEPLAGSLTRLNRATAGDERRSLPHLARKEVS